MIVNKNMKSKLSEANIDPYSSEGRSEIYCRFVLENPKDLVSIVVYTLFTNQQWFVCSLSKLGITEY